MHKKSIKWVVVIIAAAAFYACSDYNKLLKSNDIEKKYSEAHRYYKNGDCMKALTLFEELVTIFRGTARAESTYYYYAHSNYCVGDYILAAYHFKNFSRNYPNSKHAEECAFLAAYCYTLESPRYSLDQTDTKAAINELQLFINAYPNSSKLGECNDLVDKLRSKLERKSFEIAKQYYDIEDYKGAIIAMQNMVKEFPDTGYREEAMYYMLKASYRYASKSIETKKKERLEEAIGYYQKLVVNFPNSKHANEAQWIYNNLLMQKEKINKNK